jgi:hypothetical protein
MALMLQLMLSYPGVVLTALLGVVLLYWLSVIVGAVHLDTSHADGALDAAADGAVDALAAKGAAADGALDGHVDAGDVDLGSDHAGGPHGAETGMLAALKLRKVPATVSLSLLITFTWLFTVLGMDGVVRLWPEASRALVGTGVLAAAALLAMPLTSLAIRPLIPLFRHRTATRQRELVGQLCVVRTGTVDESFGEATLEDGGAGLVVRVRVDAGDPMKRGEQAVIVGFDEEREVFVVAPMSTAEREMRR